MYGHVRLVRLTGIQSFDLTAQPRRYRANPVIARFTWFTYLKVYVNLMNLAVLTVHKFITVHK